MLLRAVWQTPSNVCVCDIKVKRVYKVKTVKEWSEESDKSKKSEKSDESEENIKEKFFSKGIVNLYKYYISFQFSWKHFDLSFVPDVAA